MDEDLRPVLEDTLRRVAALEERIGEVVGILEQIEGRLDDLEVAFLDLRRTVDHIEDEIAIGDAQ